MEIPTTALKNTWSRMRTAIRSIAEVAKAEPKYLASIRPIVSQALQILEEAPSLDCANELQYNLKRIDEFIAQWRPSPNSSSGSLYIQPSWASDADRETQEALRLIEDARQKLSETPYEHGQANHIMVLLD